MKCLLTAIAIAILAFSPARVVAQSCDSLAFEVTAELSADPGFEGMYKYTLTGYWAVSGVEQGSALSNFIISLGIECPCLCQEGEEVLFPYPAGTSTGVDDEEEPCDYAEFIGEVQCGGYEDITTDDIIKFELTEGLCEPVDSGSGTWVLYSTMPPMDPAVFSDAVIMKYGEMFCVGDISGELPDCYDCMTTDASEESWGAIKKKFH
jgi:hypothetical protein